MDIIDAAQARAEIDTERAIAAQRARRIEPSAICICGCGEKVEPARFVAGLCRTLECQRRHEAGERAYGRRA